MEKHEPELKPTEYAGFWPRFVAFLIDALIVSIIQSALVPVISFGFVQPWFWWTNSFSNDPDMLALWFLGTGGVLLIIIAGAYFVGFWVWKGQSPGKMAMKIELVSVDSPVITAEKALLRYLVYIVCNILLLIPYFWVAIDTRKQGIHDKFADTYVIKSHRES